MARNIITCQGSGNPTPSDIETAFNALFLTLLDAEIKSFQVVMSDAAPAARRTFRLVIDYNSGGALMSGPWQLKCFQGESEVEAAFTLNAYITANPTKFISPVMYQYADQAQNQPFRVVLVVAVSSDATNAATNWAVGGGGGGGGGAPSGPAGGDLSGNYPNPVVGPTVTGEDDSGALGVGANVLDAQNPAVFGDAEWRVQLINTVTGARYSTTVRANIGDGVTPVWGEHEIEIYPPTGGTFDCPLTVDISGGSLRLVATPAGANWEARSAQRLLTT